MVVASGLPAARKGRCVPVALAAPDSSFKPTLLRNAA